MSERKKWIAFSLDPEGALQVNQGAAQMLSKGGKSLLPSGIIAVKGEFEAGACVEIKDEEGRVFARGLAAYGAQDLRKLMGAHSSRIEELIGFRMGDEAVHRDNMAMSTLVRNGR